MLTRRLNALVDGGLLERRRYSERPPRDEYILTAIAGAFPSRGQRQSCIAWGAAVFFPEGAVTLLTECW